MVHVIFTHQMLGTARCLFVTEPLAEYIYLLHVCEPYVTMLIVT